MIERLKKSLNFVLLAFLAYAIKLLLVEASYADGMVLAVLASIHGYKSYLKATLDKKLDDAKLKEIKEDVQEMKSALSSLNITKIKPNNRKYF